MTFLHDSSSSVFDFMQTKEHVKLCRVVTQYQTKYDK